MKRNRTYLFIAISSLALLTVLIIQVSWILKAAEVKRQLFNEKANMVLTSTAQVLRADTTTFRNLGLRIGKTETRKIDSIFNHYMKLYNVKIGYYFEVQPGQASEESTPSGSLNYNPSPGCYQTCLTPGSKNNSSTSGVIDLKLVFPDEDEFILEEMSVPFITSVALILIVLIMSWRTTVSLHKEKEISERTTDFLNNMTHEFKTPLTNIALAGKMMVKEANISQVEKIKHYSGIILEENEKLRSQVEHVLSMTALERGEIPLKKVTLDFHELVQDCLKCMSVQIENAEVKLEVHLAAAHHQIAGDRTHLANAICNLLDNALKYSSHSPELIIRSSDSNGNLELMISDKGIGIEERYHAKVFDTFFRVPTGDLHDVKGFGLGLSYTRKIIELHSGSIELRSVKNEGTTFIIRLPYV